MRLLWVATKSPMPPTDGGRILLGATVACLREAGHEVRLIVPVPAGPCADAGSTCVPARPRPWLTAALRSLLTGLPLSVARHELPAVRRAVARELGSGRWDAVVSEQLQALPQCEPALDARLPVLLRAQNVESDLWAAWGRASWRGGLSRWQAARLARYEAAALERVAGVTALTTEDARRLQDLAPRARVRVLPAPFPALLPPGDQPLSGAPALVVLAGGWRPNLDGARWFVAEVWPLVRARHPAARLHVFGATFAAPGLISHAAPPDSRSAFAPGCLHVVPLRAASGVRIKILEAWARGTPVVATRRAAAGLGAEHRRELLLADDAAAFAEAAGALVDEPGLGPRLAAAGRARLTAEHSPAAVAQAWSAWLAEVTKQG